MPWIKNKSTETPHQCDVPLNYEESGYTSGDIWECETCSSMYRATPVGNAVVMVKMGWAATMWFRFIQERMNS